MREIHFQPRTTTRDVSKLGLRHRRRYAHGYGSGSHSKIRSTNMISCLSNVLQLQVVDTLPWSDWRATLPIMFENAFEHWSRCRVSNTFTEPTTHVPEPRCTNPKIGGLVLGIGSATPLPRRAISCRARCVLLSRKAHVFAKSAFSRPRCESETHNGNVALDVSKKEVPKCLRATVCVTTLFGPSISPSISPSASAMCWCFRVKQPRKWNQRALLARQFTGVLPCQLCFVDKRNVMTGNKPSF